MIDSHEDFESQFSEKLNNSLGTENIRNSFSNTNFNKSSNVYNYNNTKNPSSNSVQKEAPKKRNIWDDEDLDDF